MILDAFFSFTTPASPFQVPNAAGTTLIGPGAGGANNQIIDLRVGLQTTSNPSGLAIPGVAAGGGARGPRVWDKPSLQFPPGCGGAFTPARPTAGPSQNL